MTHKRVLFLCTGNSARSQMAEGLVNALLSDTWRAYSAGTKPSGYVHPLAILAMAELDIDLSEQWSKSTDTFREQPFDLVITVCDNAASNCPTWLGAGTTVHLGFPDPAAATGGDRAQLQVFRDIRDAIRDEVVDFVARWDGDALPEFRL